MASMTKADFPAITPENYGGINELRTELLKAFTHAAEHPASGQVLMNFIYDSFYAGMAYIEVLDDPAVR